MADVGRLENDGKNAGKEFKKDTIKNDVK